MTTADRETPPSPRAEVQDAGACIVCWRPGERAHLIDRSLFPDPYEDPRRVVPLCREHHEAYDAHRLDLLPHLEPRLRSELARAVEIHGLIGTLERVTGRHWEPVPPLPGARAAARMALGTIEQTPEQVAT